LHCSEFPYDVVARSITGVISVGGAHRGSIIADQVCNPRAYGSPPQRAGECTPARRWLQRDTQFQVHNYSSAPAKLVWLIGGYKDNFLTRDRLPGSDDGLLQYATQFACS